MNRTHALSTLLVALSYALIACTSDPVDVGRADSGRRDSGATDSGMALPDSGARDGGPPVDSGPPPDGGDVDGGAPLPAYCPTIAPAGPAPTCPPLAMRTMVPISGEISADATWTCMQRPRLTGPTFVTGGTLTIQAGTTIEGDNGSYLIVTPSARIRAEGHPAAPVVFTSSRAVGMRDRGDWGGLVLLGRAPINVVGGTNGIEGLPAGEMRGTYGGTDAAHDCGTLRYTRVEFAGFELSMGNELNGLTLGGCGSATTVDHVQVHRGRDDAFEMFGGSPNLSFVVASGQDDDGLDWDLGYSGRIQFAIVHHYSDSFSSDPNGIEADGNRDSNDATPRSSPTVFNVTVIGTGADGREIGALLRRGTLGTIRNAIFTRFPSRGINVRDASSIDAVGTTLSVASSAFFMNGMGGSAHFAYGSGMSVTTDTWFSTAPAMNRLDVDPMLGSLSETTPSYAPATSAPLTGGATPPAMFQTQTTYLGAVGPGCPDWTTGWTSFVAN